MVNGEKENVATFGVFQEENKSGEVLFVVNAKEIEIGVFGKTEDFLCWHILGGWEGFFVDGFQDCPVFCCGIMMIGVQYFQL